ncbi:histone-lysine N-methyltransferase SETMAR [Elysia marginata]|uniref:Histone-lysine N-methyltransferase SETMAR n=1 Tax=Elysia marginata TaxID=1093978 RepID=A0AAV4GF80_9GAST|nr:histone-lysine N-methyltransferase SETMAR [Elysia marginata]
MTWKYPSSPVTKKFKVQRSAAKEMATVFWDAKGVILVDVLPHGQGINGAQYCSTHDRLRDVICRKRPGLLRRHKYKTALTWTRYHHQPLTPSDCRSTISPCDTPG